MNVLGWIGDKIIDVLLKILFLIDNIIYDLVRISYKVFINIAKVRLGDGNALDIILKRIYIIIGFFMVFVLAYNLLVYIIDPDKVTKKEGAGDLIKKIITALVVIVATPTLCNELYSIQNVILDSQVIQRLLVSSEKTPGPVEQYDYNKKNKLSSFDFGANMMIANVYSAFIFPIEEDDSPIGSSYDCYTQLSDAYSEEKYNTKNFGKPSDNSEISQYCDRYLWVIETGNINYMGLFVTDQENYRYLFIISTIAGGMLLYFFLSFSVGLAGRAAKLLVLELIAPIPALIDIVPNQSGRLRAWGKELSSQFLQVFIFEFVIFGSVWMISLVPSVIGGVLSSFDDSNGNALVISFTIVLLIFGILKVAKELPKMVCDILGIKDTGLISNNLGSFFGAGAMIGGGVLTAARGWAAGKGIHKLGNAVGGLAKGTALGAYNGLNVKRFRDVGNSVRNTYSGIESRQAQRLERRNERRNRNLTTYGYVQGQNLRNIGRNIRGHYKDMQYDARAAYGMGNDFNRMNDKIKRAQQVASAFDTIQSHVDKTVKEVKEAKALYDGFKNNWSYDNARNAEMEMINNGVFTGDRFSDFHNNYKSNEELMAEYNSKVKDLSVIDEKMADIAKKRADIAQRRINLSNREDLSNAEREIFENELNNKENELNVYEAQMRILEDQMKDNNRIALEELQSAKTENEQRLHDYEKAIEKALKDEYENQSRIAFANMDSDSYGASVLNESNKIANDDRNGIDILYDGVQTDIGINPNVYDELKNRKSQLEGGKLEMPGQAADTTVGNINRLKNDPTYREQEDLVRKQTENKK